MKVFYPFGSKGVIAETGSKKGVRSAWLDSVPNHELLR